MRPQLSKVFHQEEIFFKKHVFTLSPTLLLQMTSELLYSLQRGNKLLPFQKPATA